MNSFKKISAGIFLTAFVWALCSFIAKKEKPTLFLIGDSTVRTGQGNGENGQWGWGSFIADYFNTDQFEVQNRAMGGTSTRTFYSNPDLWAKVLDDIQDGDFLIMQFGHNDSSPIVDNLRARGTIKGNGNESQVVDNPLLNKKETVYSYGYYLRLFIKSVREKGARVIVCSPIPRNKWNNGRVERSQYAVWAREAAEQENAFFIPLEDLIVEAYEKKGAKEVGELYFGPKDHTHTLRAGAELNAFLIAEYLKNNPGTGLDEYLKK